MEQIDVFKAKIVRPHANVAWGFRLEGGAEHGLPLKVHRVSPGSPAHQIGISANDAITEIGDVSTDRLTFKQAHELIAQFRDTIFLTIERKAHGQVPQNPLVSHPQHDNPRSYQTYDLTGSKKPAPQYQPARAPQMPPPPHRPHEQDSTKLYQTYDLNGPKAYTPPSMQRTHQYNSADFPTAQSRLFEAPARPYRPPAPQPAVPSPTRTVPDGPGFSQGVKYIPEEEKVGGDVSQSKTFKILQSLMQNDEEYSGVSGLPPPRSLEQERWKEEYARQHPGARVRVFVPQKYNSPMDLYSAPNVVDSFQQQATGYFEELESKERLATVHDGVAPNVVYRSKTAQAVYEDDMRQHRNEVTAKRASQIMQEIMGSSVEEKPPGSLQREITRRRDLPEVQNLVSQPVASSVPPAQPATPVLLQPSVSPASPFKPVEPPVVVQRPEPPPVQKPEPSKQICQQPVPASTNQPSQYEPKTGKGKRVRPKPGPQDSTVGVQYGPIPDFVSGRGPDYVEQTEEHHISIVPPKQANVNQEPKSGVSEGKEASALAGTDEGIKQSPGTSGKTPDQSGKPNVIEDLVTQKKDHGEKVLTGKPETKEDTVAVHDEAKIANESKNKVEEPEEPAGESSEVGTEVNINISLDGSPSESVEADQRKQTEQEQQEPQEEVKEATTEIKPVGEQTEQSTQQTEDKILSEEPKNKSGEAITDESSEAFVTDSKKQRDVDDVVDASKETSVADFENEQQKSIDDSVKTCDEPTKDTEFGKEMAEAKEKLPKEAPLGTEQPAIETRETAEVKL